MKIINNKWCKNNIYLIILFVLSIFVLFYNLGGDSLQNWDEGFYTLIYHQSNFAKDGFTIFLNGSPFFEKPPLGLWMNSLFIKIFGVSELAIRFLPTLFSLGSIIILYFLGTYLFNRRVGFFTSFITVISPAFLYDHISRRGDLEGGYLFLFLLTIYLFVLSWEKPKMLFWSAMSLGLVLMYRGNSAILLLLIILSYILITNSWKIYTLKIWLSSIIIFLIFILPWHINQLIIYGKSFYNIYIKEHFLGRINKPMHNHSYKWDHYFMFLHWKDGLLFTLGIFSLFFTIFRVFFKKDQQKYILLLLWILFFTLPLIFMQTKLYWYVLPLIPALSLLVVSFLDEIIVKNKKVLLLLVSLFITICWFFVDKTNLLFFSNIQLFKYYLIDILVAILVYFIVKYIIKYKNLNFLSVFIIIIIINLMIIYLYQDWQNIKIKHKDPIDLISRKMDNLIKGKENIVVYNTEYWMNGQLTPQAYYYLIIKHPKWSVYSVDKNSLDRYLNDSYHWFITTPNSLIDLSKDANNLKNLEIKFLEKDKILVYIHYQ